MDIRRENTKAESLTTSIKIINDASIHCDTGKSSEVIPYPSGPKPSKQLSNTSCQYRLPLISNKGNGDNTRRHTLSSTKDIRSSTISPGKRYRSTSIHHTQRPYLDFEKMLQVSQINVHLSHDTSNVI